MGERGVIPNQTASVAVKDGAVPIVTRRGLTKGPALVVVPSIFGITDDLLAQLETLADEAAVVVVMDLFWRGEPGPVPYEDMATVMGRLQGLDRRRAYGDFRAVVAWAAHHAGCDGRVVGLGICFGGPFCLLGAADGLLDGVVTWHGTRLEAFLERAGEVRCPMALHFGERDRVVSLEAVGQVRDAFGGRADVEVVVHPGADHGYSHAGGPTWDPAAAAAGLKAAKRILAG